MCGVVGYVTNGCSASEIELLSRVFEQSKIRGLHSCGFSYVDGDVIVTEKFYGVGNLMAALVRLGEKHNGQPLRLIGHTRYSTSGDWNTRRNNQPLHIEGFGTHQIALAFNGCIHMGRREEYEAVYREKYETDNDGEIFCRKVLRGQDWEGFVATGGFSFAGVFLHRGQLYALRNRNRPLHIGHWGGAVFVASTRDILRRAGFPGEAMEVVPCVAHQLSS